MIKNTAENASDDWPEKPPRWHLRVEPDGTLTAETAGLNPPLAVTGDTLASLRKQAKDVKTRPDPGPG